MERQCILVIVCHQRKNLFILRQKESFSLPAINYTRSRIHDQGEHFRFLIQKQYGIQDALLLRHLLSEEVDFCLFETKQNCHFSQENQVWFPIEKLEELSLVTPTRQTLILSHLSLSKPPQRAAWENFGWNQKACEWITEEFKKKKLGRIQSIEQIKAAWGWSNVLKILTESGNYYFKADIQKSPQEAAVVFILQEHFPNHLPEIVSWDQERNWMISKDFLQQPDKNPSLEVCEQVIQTFAVAQYS